MSTQREGKNALGREARRGASVTARDGPLNAAKQERGNRVRLSLDVSRELYELLEELAEKTDSTKSDVLRRSVALMEVYVDAKQQGKKFGIADKDQPLATEIVGI